MTPGPGAGGRQGFALIAVLWMLMLAGVIGISLIHLSRSERRSAVIEANRVQARLLADGAIRRVILSLMTPSLGEHWSFDGTSRNVPLFGQDIAVRLESESGKVDLGAASSDKIAALFRSLGAGGADAGLLAARIEEWQAPLAIGPDIADDPYRQDELRYGPRHGAFRSVGELRMVHGMTAELFRQVTPLVTVYSHLPSADPHVASGEVLRALDAAGDALAHSWRLRKEAGENTGNEVPALTGVAMTIRATAEKGEARVSRRAVVRLGGNGETPYVVLDWE